jgi:glycogen debranching enzyme
MGTVAGGLTRRYHGLLVAATAPPVRRVLLLAALEGELEIGAGGPGIGTGAGTAMAAERSAERPQSRTIPLWSQEWSDGSLSPWGHLHLEEFRLEGMVPVAIWAFGGHRIERRIWMPHGSNAVALRYTMASGSPARLRLRALTTHRSHHATIPTPRPAPAIEHAEHGVRVTAYSGAVPLWIQSRDARVQPAAGEAWSGVLLRTERDRGYDCIDSHHHSATIEAELTAGSSITIVAGLEAAAELDGEALWMTQWQRTRRLLSLAGDPADRFESALVLAADQFTVARRVKAGGPARPAGGALGAAARSLGPEVYEGGSIIAGYPWFEDWGRDTFIALPGLLLATGRAADAERVVRTFASALDRGMLPNRFPDEGGAAEHHTVDATLWFVESACRTIEALPATEGTALLEDLATPFAEILHWHVEGTRHGIRLDPTDGLLRAGEPGVQLTWMDAKVGDRVITPRIGKPVEIAALWHATLRRLSRASGRLGAPLGEFSQARLSEMAERARAGFERFWNPARGCLHDVIDGPEGPDPSVRPNQLVAVALADSPVDDGRAAMIVGRCAELLLTSLGMRTLEPGDPRFAPAYRGGQELRDAVYHQGTVWPWLLAPFALAHFRVHQDRAAVRALLEPLRLHLCDAGLGSISEVCDGDVPYLPGGCPAQAWSVAAALEVMARIRQGDGDSSQPR